MLGTHQPEEGHRGIGVGHHLAAGSSTPFSSTTPVARPSAALCHRSPGADLRPAAGRAEAIASLGDPIPPLTYPRRPRPVALSHHVVEEHIGGPRCRRGSHLDDRVGGERGLQLIGLEPPIEDGPRRGGQDLQRPRSVLPQAEESPPRPGEPEEVAGTRENRSAGVSRIVGSIATAIRSASPRTRGRSASRTENLDTSRWFSSGSGPMRRDRPSGNGVNEDGLRGRSWYPCRASSRSRTISGRKDSPRTRQSRPGTPARALRDGGPARGRAPRAPAPSAGARGTRRSRARCGPLRRR